MIKRLVKLTFQQGKADIFLNEILPNQKYFTRNFDGCEHLEIWKDVNNEHILFSFSIWQSEKHLNHYRHSEKFKQFWKETKMLFADKAYAVSVKEVETVNLKK